jgi:hypothetical protein
VRAAGFARLNAVMKDNPPADADADAMKRFAAISVAPGKPFDPAKLDPAVAKGIKRGARAAQEKGIVRNEPNSVGRESAAP